MKVKCIANEGNALSNKQMDAGESMKSEFRLTINAEYTVYAMSLWKGTINYLTLNKYNHPSWHPAELFEVVDNILPLEWYYKFFGYRDDFYLNAIWGYKELIDPVYYDELIEREPEAIRIFWKRKKEIDEYYE